MKNRVLRLALVVVLVMAMVLTMAACGDPKPTPTPTPTPSTTPTTPTPTPTPSKTPDKPTSGTDENETIAKQFGVTVEDFKGTYGDKDADKVSTTFVTIKADKALSADEQYRVLLATTTAGTYVDVATGLVYEVDANGLATMRANNAGALAPTDKVAVSYEGDAAGITELVLGVKKNADGSFKALFVETKTAGLYEFEYELIVVDQAADYGAWNGEKENLEFTLTATSEVAKKALEIETNPIVAKEDNGTLELDGAVVKTNHVEGITITTTTFSTFVTDMKIADLTTDSLATLGLTAAEVDTATEAATETAKVMRYTLSFTKEAKVGEYSVKVELVNADTAAGDKAAAEAIAIEDLVWVNYEATMKDSKIYVVSAYDWNEIRDVVTSVTEIDYTAAKNFFDTTKNVSTQLPLAKARYDALTDAQKAFFKTGVVQQVGPDVVGTHIQLWEAAYENAAAGIAKGELEGTNSADNPLVAAYKASTVKIYMDEAEVAAEKAAKIAAFKKVVDDSKLATYQSVKVNAGEYESDTITFDVKNSAAMAAFNTVHTYYEALSDADKAIVVPKDAGAIDYTEAKTTKEAAIYGLAKAAVDAKDIAAVQELIAGAFNAYAKALDNNAKIVYQFTSGTAVGGVTAWAYINNSEVKALTAQAKTAYDKLTDAQKGALGVDAEGRIADITGKVVFENDGSAILSYKVALLRLAGMNEMISYMEKIANYVNINDYSVIEVPYDRLNQIVYGHLADGTGNNDGNFDTTRFAMKDLILAPARNYEAIIAEYQAWIDYVIAIEDFKANLVEEFKKLVTTEYTENAEDYSDSTIASAMNFDNATMKAIVKIITQETHGEQIVQVRPEVKATIIAANDTFFKKVIALDEKTFEDLKEEWADVVDLDAAFTAYTTAFAPQP